MALNRADAVRKMAQAIYNSGDDASRRSVLDLCKKAADGEPAARWAREGAKRLASAVGIDPGIILEGGQPFLVETVVFGVLAPVFVVRGDAVVFDGTRPDPMGWIPKISGAVTCH